MKELSPAAGLRLINTGPAVVATCGPPDAPNGIALAWNMVVSRNPALLAVSVAPERYSHDLMIDRGCFVVNVAGRDNLDFLMMCGTRSGRDTDKFAAAGIEARKASSVDTVYAPGFPARIECAVFGSRPCGDHSLIVGEVKAAFVEEDFFDERWKLDAPERCTLHHLGGPHFGLLSQKTTWRP